MTPDNIPVIDMARLNDNNIILEIDRALSRWGFMYIRNHGISEDLIKSLVQVSRNFFRLDLQTKMKISMNLAGKAWRGYFPLKGELTSGKPDQKEGLYFGKELSPSEVPLHGPNQWPVGQEYAVFRKNILEYMVVMTTLSQKLMGAIGLGLGLPENYFQNRFTNDPTILLRIFNYPQHTWQEGKDEWGVREHTDMGFLTILLQDNSGGLQIKSLDGSWIHAPPVDGTFVVNIGDMLEVWTHGIYRATPHRVRNMGSSDRLSIPFFFDPNWSCTLEPIPTELLQTDKLKAAGSRSRERWDGLKLAELTGKITYGEFVWTKVKQVFPNISTSPE